MNEPKTLTLPAHLTIALKLLDSHIADLKTSKIQLLRTHLRAEHIDGEWGIDDGNTFLIHVEQPEQPAQSQENN